MSMQSKRCQSGLAKFSISSLFILLLGISGTGMVFAESGAVLSWEPAEWGKPAVYHLGNDQSGPIAGDDGFSPEFKKILSSNPAALKEAQQAESSSSVVVAGWAVLLAGTVLELKETMDQADDPLGESESGKGLGFVIVGAVITLIGTSNYKSHMNSSIRLYNQGVEQGARRPITPPENSLQFGLSTKPDSSASNKFRSSDVALLGTVRLSF